MKIGSLKIVKLHSMRNFGRSDKRSDLFQSLKHEKGEEKEEEWKSWCHDHVV